jgi:hypothetical protein
VRLEGWLWRERRDVVGGGGIFYLSMTCRSRHSPPRFSLCPVRPERPLWTGDGFGTPNTALCRAEWKKVLERAVENEKLSDPPQISLGGAVGDAHRSFQVGRPCCGGLVKLHFGGWRPSDLKRAVLHATPTLLACFSCPHPSSRH